MNCRHCHSKLERLFLDLGFAPPSNAYLNEAQLKAPEKYYPLRLFVCEDCWLVQTDDYTQADELFDKNYAYFSSVSKGWLDHASKYCSMVTNKLGLNKDSLVVEIASNDGYLLKNFINAQIPCLGIEPTLSTAAEAEALGIPVLKEFFQKALAEQLVKSGRSADLIISNNVFAHVPTINDFTDGIKLLLKPEGTVTLEFPHLLKLLEQRQFDTVYHEHFSYLSLYTTIQIFEKAGLRVYDVEELNTHGGSLRIYGCHQESKMATSDNIARVLAKEVEFGMQTLEPYIHFQGLAENVKNDVIEFLISQYKLGKKVGAYGAAAKGCTLLNFAGIKTDLLPFVCDAAPSKQNHFLPGSHIPILPPNELKILKPDFVFILPWNIKEEVIEQLSYIRDWGGKFVVAIPKLTVL